nr:MAG TPA: hypothetical protein [Ackermannviridae sp.]
MNIMFSLRTVYFQYILFCFGNIFNFRTECLIFEI